MTLPHPPSQKKNLSRRAVLSITGIFGNLSVCCVILRIPSMRSATNYYLFSLAVADLLILLLGKPAATVHPKKCFSLL